MTAMTDAEAWGVFAEMIAGAGCLPEYYSSDYAGCLGLCAMLCSAHICGIIGVKQLRRMEMQLKSYGVNSGVDRWGYYWPLRKWQPRACACKEISRLLLEGKL